MQQDADQNYQDALDRLAAKCPVVQNGDYLERVDAISRDKVAELTEEEARKTARADMQPYLDLE